MALGPGKYDKLCTIVRKRAKAEAALVIVLNGELGSGFSCQASADLLLTLPAMLRHMADEIDKSGGRA